MLKLEQYRSKHGKCFVVGDIMLDAYISGDVSRVSPEAPVPVIRVKKRSHALGGAANVAAGIRALGAQAVLAGAIGNDGGADILFRTLEEFGILFEGLVSEKRATTIKTRLIGNESQITRFDEEDTDELCAADEAGLLAICGSKIKEADVVVISDYNKGVCTPEVCRTVIECANVHGVPVIVDPKHYDWARYKGAYLIAPNLVEFGEAVRYLLKRPPKDIHADAAELMVEYDIANILVTRSKDGMTLVRGGGTEAIDFAAKSKEVYDVSGAGDTVVAALAAFLAAGAELEDAVKIANTAAGISVAKSGTYAVTLQDMGDEIGSKVVSEDAAHGMVAKWKEQGKKIVFTNGCFDIVHAGHISLLKQSKLFGDVLIVGLNSDASVRRLKGDGRPINSEADRAVILSAFEAVDAVVLFDGDTPIELIESIKPDVLVKGADYTAETVVGADIVASYGGRLELVELVREKSTSNIIRAIVSK